MPELIITILIVALGSIVLLVVLFLLVRYAYKKFLLSVKETVLLDKALDMVIFEIQVPHDNEIAIKEADQMFSGFLQIGEKLEGLKRYTKARPYISLEIVAFKDNIKFYVLCPKKLATLVDRQINGAYPTAEVVRSKEPNIFREGAEVAYAVMEQAKEKYIPIQTYDELAADSLATLTDAMSKLHEGEAAAVQLVITAAGTDWRNDAKAYVKAKRDKAAKSTEEGGSKSSAPDDESLGLIDRKAEKSGFFADLRVAVVSDTKMQAEEHLNNILSSFDQLSKETGNKLKKKKKVVNFVHDFIYRLPRDTMLLNTAELATLYHFPNKNIRTPHIQWLQSKDAPAADFVPSEYQPGFIWLGKNIYRGQSKEIFMRPEDRVRHTYVIGQTGTGKTTFLAGLAIRDIKAGRGVAFVDPHGSDTEEILKHIPPERVEDVVYFNPADTERPLGLNMLEFYSPDQKTFVINEMLNIFDKLYDLKQTGGPIFEQYMRNAIMLLMEDVESGNTLMEISKVLSDDGYRKYKLSKSTNPEVIQFWEQQAEKAGGEAALQNVVPYITSKLTAFVSNDIMRPIISQQKSTVDFRWAMDNKKIILVNLSKGRIGELNAYLLGMVIVGKILSAAFSRVDTDPKLINPFYLYIDEFQNFLTDSVVTILSEARKYGLSLNIAHQFLGQLTLKGGDTKIKEAIFGNVGTKIVFRVGIDDAKVFAQDFEGLFTAEDISKQPNYHAYTRLLVGGKYPPPFSLDFPIDAPFAQRDRPNEEIAELVKQISRLRFGRDREIVEQEIKDRAKFVKEVKKETKGGGMFGDLGGLFGGKP